MAFFGYMEGALRSGERAANTLIRNACGLQEAVLAEGELPAREESEQSEENQLTPQPDEAQGEFLQSREGLEELNSRCSGFVPARHAQDILFVGAERRDEFKDAGRLLCQGHGVVAINPPETAPAKAFRRSGGKFIRGRIEHLPPDSCRFDLIRERHRCPSGRNYVPVRPFALARLSLLKPRGRWILITESPRYASLLKAVGDYDEALQRDFTVTLSKIAPDEAAYSQGKIRFRLVFQRCR
jgi:hypothetical protein